MSRRTDTYKVGMERRIGDVAFLNSLMADYKNILIDFYHPYYKTMSDYERMTKNTVKNRMIGGDMDTNMGLDLKMTYGSKVVLIATRRYKIGLIHKLPTKVDLDKFTKEFLIHYYYLLFNETRTHYHLISVKDEILNKAHPVRSETKGNRNRIMFHTGKRYLSTSDYEKYPINGLKTFTGNIPSLKEALLNLVK